MLRGGRNLPSESSTFTYFTVITKTAIFKKTMINIQRININSILEV